MVEGQINSNKLPILTVTTSASEHTKLVSPQDTPPHLIFQRLGRGLVGFGEVVRAEFSGPQRFVEAQSWWKKLADKSVVADSIGRPGSGLAAFGAFTFSDRSAQRSVLIVPERVIGIDECGAFETRIENGQEVTQLASHSAADSPTPKTQNGWAGSSVTEQRFLSLVKKGKEMIQSGHLHKVVLARDLVHTLPPSVSLDGLAAKLAESYPDTFVFFVDGLIGASPETLASVRNKNITLRVLAGSAKRGVDDRDDQRQARTLATSRKDLDEHRFAVQNVLQTLETHDITAVADEVPFQLKLPNLWHLATDIRGVLPSSTGSIQLIGSLHPTAAVAGSPTSAAREVIDNLEGLDRGRYAGPVGWVDGNGDGDWAIALRCAQIDTHAHTITAYAGAGVVAESDEMEELLETELKFRPIIEAVNEKLR